MHRFLVDRFRDVVVDDRARRTATAAPRGNAKTTWISTIGPIWCLCFPERARKKFIVLLSDTAPQADANLEAIRYELESNQLLRQDFGDMVGRPQRDNRAWRSKKLITMSGITIQSVSSGMALRGMRKGASRPDLLVADDLEAPEHVHTPAQRKKLASWWTKDVTKLAGPAGMDIFVVGTILHYESLLSSLLANAGYHSEKFQAVAAWPVRQDMWDEWQVIYTDLSRSEKQRKDDGLAFYEERRADMDDGAEVLWPEGDSLYSLMETLTTDGPAAFDSEKQNEPVNPEDCIFAEEWFRWYRKVGEMGEPTDLALPTILSTVGAVDPSMGKRANRGDYSAIVILGRGDDGRDYVLEADIQRRSPDCIITDVLALHEEYHCSCWVVEAIQFQEFFRQQLNARALADGVHLPTLPVYPSTDKELRIQSLQPAIRNGNIVFHRSQKLLYDQLRLFPLAGHDDGPDAVQMAYEYGQEMAVPSTAPDIGYRQPPNTRSGLSVQGGRGGVGRSEGRQMHLNRGMAPRANRGR